MDYWSQERKVVLPSVTDPFYTIEMKVLVWNFGKVPTFCLIGSLNKQMCKITLKLIINSLESNTNTSLFLLSPPHFLKTYSEGAVILVWWFATMLCECPLAVSPPSGITTLGPAEWHRSWVEYIQLSCDLSLGKVRGLLIYWQDLACSLVIPSTNVALIHVYKYNHQTMRGSKLVWKHLEIPSTSVEDLQTVCIQISNIWDVGQTRTLLTLKCRQKGTFLTQVTGTYASVVCAHSVHANVLHINICKLTSSGLLSQINDTVGKRCPPFLIYFFMTRNLMKYYFCQSCHDLTPFVFLFS